MSDLDPKRYRRCEGKKAHATEAEAKLSGQLPYHCRYCGLWHCTSVGGSLRSYIHHELTQRKLERGRQYRLRHLRPDEPDWQAEEER